MQKPSSVYAIIPARYASSRFPGKMLANIKGKPLIQWTYENTLQSACFDHVLVATDHQEIFDCCKGFNAPVVMTDPEHPTGTDRIIEAAKTQANLQETDIIINVQGDEPFVSKESFRALINALKEDESCGMATGSYYLKDKEKIQNPSCVKCVVDQKGYALYFSRSPIPYIQKEREEIQNSYLGHLGIYAFRWNFLKKFKNLSPTPLFLQEDLEQLKVLEHGYKIKTVLIQGEEGLGVNEKDDIKEVEEYLCKQNIS